MGVTWILQPRIGPSAHCATTEIRATVAVGLPRSDAVRMHPLDLDVRRLLIYRQVALSGSLGAAARVLGWTQPAVSQQMRALEKEAGCPLVLRTSKGVVPT